MRRNGIVSIWVLAWFCACEGSYEGPGDLADAGQNEAKAADGGSLEGDGGASQHPAHSAGDGGMALQDGGPDGPDGSDGPEGVPDAGPKPVPVIGYTSSSATRGLNSQSGVHSLGRQFEVTGDDVRMVELGMWDHQGDGLARAHTVTLFKLDKAGLGALATPVVGGSVSVPQGTSAPLEAGFRFAPLAQPILLEKGLYAVVAYGLDAADPYGDGGNVPLASTGVRHLDFDVFQGTESQSPTFPANGDGNQHSAASFRYTSATSKFVKLMPLGASITEGVGSSGGGYRAQLGKLLDQAGVAHQFVGSMTNNTGPLGKDQVHHEGHSGSVITAGETKRPGITDNIERWLGPNGVDPDIILLLVGTNDVDLDNKLSEAPSRMSHLLSMILDKDTGLRPHAKVILARLPPINDDSEDARCVKYNDGIAETALEHAARGEDVTVVDMHPVVDRKTQLSDKLHPNDAGYANIAKVWFDAIMTKL